MIRIDKAKHAACALLLALALPGCDAGAPTPVSSAQAEPVAGAMGWPEPSPNAVADGNVFNYE